MSIIRVNGQSKVPPGFRFHPTEEELLQYYLRKKVSHQQIDLDVIKDVDLNKFEPWDIQEMCKIGSTPQNEWYFFSHKDKKYPTGTRTNRATAAGFWKATGRDKVIYGSNCRRRIGMRKTLVFYKGRAPLGLRCDWIMHEYRLLDDNNDNNTSSTDDANNTDVSCSGVEETLVLLVKEEGWVVCRIFKKKDHIIKTLRNPLITTSSSSMITTSISTSTIDDQTTTQTLINSVCNEEGTLEQIINMGRMTFKDKNSANNITSRLLIHPTVILANTANNNNNDNNNNVSLKDKFLELPNLETTNSVFNLSEISLSNWPARLDDPMSMDFGSLNSNDHLDHDLQILHQLQSSLSSSSSSSSSLPSYTPHLQTMLDYFNTQTNHL